MTNFSILKKYLFIFTSATLLLFSSYTLFISIKSHIQFINFPYQHEYLEGAVLRITELYVDNENPYEIKYQPQDSYAYGFLYPLIVSQFAKAFGNNLSIHRWISYVFILLSCLLIFIALLKMKVNPVFSFTAVVILHQSFIYNGLISIARPEGLGILLYILGILIPWRFKFSSWSCVVSIILGLLGYLTKPYYVLVIPLIGIYMFFFVSKRRSIIFGIISLVLFLITVIAVGFIYETYHNNTYVQYTYTLTYEFYHMKEQLFKYLNVNVFLFIIIIFSCIVILKKYFYHEHTFKGAFKTIENKFLCNKNINLFRDEPIIKTKYDLLFGFVSLFSIFLFIVKLGGNVGASKGTYLFHLCSPFLILTTFQFIVATDNKVVQGIIAIFLIISLRRQYKARSYDFERLVNDYKKTEEIMGKSRTILNSPETVSIMIQQNKTIYNSGHSAGLRSVSFFLGASSGVEERSNVFKKELNKKISNKEFDLILTSKITKYYEDSHIDSSVLNQNYQCTDTLNGPLSKIETWYPKSK